MATLPQPAAIPGQVKSVRLGGRIKVLETWFDDEPEGLADCDVWISHQRTRPLSPGGWLYFYTLHLDLTQSAEALLKNMRKNTSREIRQAEERDGLLESFNASPNDQDLADYARFYDGNPHAPDQAPMDLGRLQALNAAGLVRLTGVRDADGVALVQHCLLGHGRAGIIQLLSMVSRNHDPQDRGQASAIGRANRWLFYRECLCYREQGFRTYDFNGWYAGLEDEKRLRINQFKEGFRGRILYGFECREGVSLRGRIYLALQAIKRRLFDPEERREHRRRRQQAQALP